MFPTRRAGISLTRIKMIVFAMASTLAAVGGIMADDNADAADMLSLLLEELGCEVQTVYDGASAVSAVGTFEPHLLFLDLGMPVVDGYDACRQIRARCARADLVIVAITGWGQEDDRRRSSLAGFDLHLTKPVDPDILVRIVNELPVREA